MKLPWPDAERVDRMTESKVSKRIASFGPKDWQPLQPPLRRPPPDRNAATEPPPASEAAS